MVLASYRSVAGVALALLTASGRPSQQGTSSAPARVRLGFSTDRLARIDTALQRAVDRGEIAGAVALVLRDGRTVYERAVGWADKEARRPMTADAIFRIASQTKALTSVAIMALAEEGTLSLGDPVDRFIPGFRRTTGGYAQRHGTSDRPRAPPHDDP